VLLFALCLAALPLAFFAYAYVGYPILLWLVGKVRRYRVVTSDPAEWPSITITVPAFNAVDKLGRTLDHLLATDYPAEKRQIVVLSDASTDGTDEMVKEVYGPKGVEVYRAPKRGGKTELENASMTVARGDIVINVDATILIPRDSIKPLIRAFGDPTVGVASGRDVSVGAEAQEANGSESGYVGYEMSVRRLETRAGRIVGASGCFYGFRRQVQAILPGELSWDFARPLFARELGYRAVSVEEAICLVPRTPALKTEFNRKVRTMARGLQTLWYKRALLNPVRYGAFAWMLFSHKLARWLVMPTIPFAVLGLALVSASQPLAQIALLGVVLGGLAGLVGLQWSASKRVPRLFALAGFALGAVVAGISAWREFFRGQNLAVWAPTPRPEASAR
jgi:cellulose synthase/poly-beta-1,6-N-acetylglucosamine synthase-like glycosyltransferase